jgi:uncharacterized secreted protein with C-terminal beta-propeller domain
MKNFFTPKRIFISLLLVVMVASFGFLKIRQMITSKTDNNPQGIATSTSQAESWMGKVTGSGEIKKFKSAEELKSFLEVNSSSNSRSGYGGGMMIKTLATPEMMRTDSATVSNGSAPSLGAPGAVSTPSPSDQAGASVNSDYSTTNIQVAGVDEADIIKTDGEYIYAVSNKNLFIIKASDEGKSEIISKIEFKSVPQDLYINGNNLVVFGYDEQIYAMPYYKSFIRQNPYVFFKVFDISDHKAPKQVRDLSFEGNYFDSRQIGDYVYFVTNNYGYGVTGDPIMPRILAEGKNLDTVCASGVKCFNPDIYYFDRPYDSYNLTSVTAINVKDATAVPTGAVYLTDASQNMFVSEKNIYITNTKYINEYDLRMELAREIIYPRLSSDLQGKISRIEAVDDFILSKYEKISKVQQIIERYVASLSQSEQEAYDKELNDKMKQKYTDLSKELEKTIIYKIAIAADKIEYKSTGEVTGSVLNQFSMDEKDGYFRIATTRNQTWSMMDSQNRESYNNVYVLDENLKVVGTLENLAEGERIYSARFIGDRAYLVTFKQVDPLFVIDLKTPSAPKVLGYLKMPGFSNYIHPYDENTLIGFGKDTVDEGNNIVRTKGLKLSLFDVSDVANPKELDSYVAGDMGSDSIALYDHKAFMFSKDKNLLVLPVTLRKSSGDNMWGEVSFSGAMVWHITDNKFVLAGQIDHNDGQIKVDPIYGNGYSYYDSSVKRSLYIKTGLYTFSDKYLKINKISDLGEIQKVDLQNNSGPDFQVINP